jgi:hypothetical protein
VARAYNVSRYVVAFGSRIMTMDRTVVANMLDDQEETLYLKTHQ